MDENNEIYDANIIEESTSVTQQNTYSNEGFNTNGLDDELYKNPKKNKRKKGGFLKVIAIVAVASLVGGLVGGGSTYLLMKSQIKANNEQASYNEPNFTEANTLSATEAFERVAPAVVIVSTKSMSNYGGFIPREVEGIGSGFIINEEGYILTNYHVIEGAQEVTVTFSDKREVKAKVVNYDQNQDVAMLKLMEDVKVPAVVELGDSTALKPGEEVIAIGTPLSKEFSQTVTKGVVSALNRNVETDTGVQLNLIQTDTPINPGNSGGPLVNTKGEVIGINTLKLSGEAEGIGFAIPINEVKGRIDSLSKPILNLGVTIRVIDEQLGKEYDLDEGLYIVDVTPFSSAEKAGIKPGDLITKFDGKRVKTFEDLKSIKDTKQEGDIVKVEIVRDKKEITIDMTLEAK